jgi:hypothetical protein
MRYKIKEDISETEVALAEIHSVIDGMAAKWPSNILARRSVSTFTGGLFSTKYLANEDSARRGPSGGFSVNGSKVYPVSSFVTWLKERAAVSWSKRKSAV